MVEIMWVRVNYKVMFIMVEETGRTQDSMLCTLNVKFQFIYWHTNHDSHSTNQLSFNIILYHTILGTSGFLYHYKHNSR
jgi:hypothetical protein